MKNNKQRHERFGAILADLVIYQVEAAVQFAADVAAYEFAAPAEAWHEQARNLIAERAGLGNITDAATMEKASMALMGHASDLAIAVHERPDTPPAMRDDALGLLLRMVATEQWVGTRSSSA